MNLPIGPYTKQDIAALIKRPTRTVKLWTDIKLVEPEIAPARGKGHIRLYSARNLIEFAMIDYMSIDMGLPHYAILGALNELRDYHFFLDSRFGVGLELLYCYETKNIQWEGDWEYKSLQVAGGRLAVDKGSGSVHEEPDFIIGLGHDEERYKELNQWVKSRDISGFTLLRLGDIRNRAMKKHQIQSIGDKK